MSNVNSAVGSDLLLGIMEGAGMNAPVVQQTWEELESLFTDIASGILKIGTEINSALSIIKPSANVLTAESLAELNTVVNGLNSDLGVFANDLAVIHDSHKHLTGVVGQDDYTTSLEIFNNYVILQDRFKALTFAPLLTITERVMEVKQALSDKNMTDLQDPKIVSDVEVKKGGTNE